MYDFRAGDYVETIDGEIGYISQITFKNGEIQITLALSDGDMMCFPSTCYKDLYKYFIRIGRHEFKKNVIDPMWDIRSRQDVMDKINEVINWINKHEE